MKIIVGKKVIRTAASLRRIIEHTMERDKNCEHEHHLLGRFITVYNCRVFGVCVYPTTLEWKGKAWFIEQMENRRSLKWRIWYAYGYIRAKAGLSHSPAKWSENVRDAITQGYFRGIGVSV